MLENLHIVYTDYCYAACSGSPHNALPGEMSWRDTFFVMTSLLGKLSVLSYLSVTCYVGLQDHGYPKLMTLKSKNNYIIISCTQLVTEQNKIINVTITYTHYYCIDIMERENINLIQL